MNVSWAKLLISTVEILNMSIDPSKFQKLNVADTCAIWNILSSRLLYMTANAAGCSFCCTNFVHYECLHKPRKAYTSEDIELQDRLQGAIQDGKFKSCHLDLEDLQEVDILQKRKNLGKGELASIAFAKKTNQAFLTDDIKARRLAQEVMTRQFVQTTPHLVGWLFFAYFLGDGDLKPVIDEHKKYDRPLAQYFNEMYSRALDYRSKLHLHWISENEEYINFGDHNY